MLAHPVGPLAGISPSMGRAAIASLTAVAGLLLRCGRRAACTGPCPAWSAHAARTARAGGGTLLLRMTAVWLSMPTIVISPVAVVSLVTFVLPTSIGIAVVSGSRAICASRSAVIARS